MEFDLNINKYLPHPITKFCAHDVARCESEFWKVLDIMGEASRVAQNLRRPVTVAHSFVTSNQTLYIMTDASANNGNGAILGMLKIGRKKLFLLDKRGVQNELDPVCVLDFYIHESCQRMGLGKLLFAHFLDDEKLHVKKIAIDRPSEKFLGFLRKHYGLVNFIPQVNNFVISEGFFDSGDESSKRSDDHTNSSFMANRCKSMIAINSPTEDNSIRPRSKLSVTDCLYDQSDCNPNDLWRAASLANINNRASPVQIVPIHSEQKSFPTETPSKFTHHRLW